MAKRFALVFFGIVCLFVLGCSESEQQNVSPRTDAAAVTDDATTTARMARSDVVRARRQFVVEVVRFDASQAFGSTFPYSDYVRLRITNNSDVTLKHLTVLTKRYDANGKMVGSSRAPSIPAADIGPGEAVEVDFYPKGHLGGVSKIDVEVEDVIDPEAEKFFPELRGIE